MIDYNRSITTTIHDADLPNALNTMFNATVTCLYRQFPRYSQIGTVVHSYFVCRFEKISAQILVVQSCADLRVVWKLTIQTRYRSIKHCIQRVRQVCIMNRSGDTAMVINHNILQCLFSKIYNYILIGPIYRSLWLSKVFINIL